VFVGEVFHVECDQVSQLAKYISMNNLYKFFGGKSVAILVVTGMISTTVVVASSLVRQSALLSQLSPLSYLSRSLPIDEDMLQLNLAAVVTLSSGVKTDFDVNKDGKVNATDLGVEASAVQAGPVTASSTNFNPRYDLDKNSIINTADWSLMTKYFVSHAGSRYLFIMNGTSAVTYSDISSIATAIQQAISGHQYFTRVDFNGDGHVTASDWEMLTSYTREVKPILLYDLDGSGAVEVRDLQSISMAIQQGIEGHQYFVAVDFNGDGQINPEDWRKVYGYVLIVKNLGSTWLDVDSNGLVNINDVNQVKSAIGRQMTRYDLDADGIVSQSDVDLASSY
jgi:Ca2+-binding EF-hand superfamily protein